MNNFIHELNFPNPLFHNLSRKDLTVLFEKEEDGHVISQPIEVQKRRPRKLKSLNCNCSIIKVLTAGIHFYTYIIKRVL